LIGKAWVGEDFRLASDGKTMISSDGLRQYRPPSFKPNLPAQYGGPGYQANFEWRTIPRKVNGRPMLISTLRTRDESHRAPLHQPGCRPRKFHPQDPEDFSFLLQALVGPADGPGEESLQFIVCTPRSIRKKLATQPIVFGRSLVIVETWGAERILAGIRLAIERIDAPTWNAVVNLFL
jgi:hypothetical protein